MLVIIPSIDILSNRQAKALLIDRISLDSFRKQLVWDHGKKCRLAGVVVYWMESYISPNP